jgi:hypothetical protein
LRTPPGIAGGRAVGDAVLAVLTNHPAESAKLVIATIAGEGDKKLVQITIEVRTGPLSAG